MHIVCTRSTQSRTPGQFQCVSASINLSKSIRLLEWNDSVKAHFHCHFSSPLLWVKVVKTKSTRPGNPPIVNIDVTKLYNKTTTLRILVIFVIHTLRIDNRVLKTKLRLS